MKKLNYVWVVEVLNEHIWSNLNPRWEPCSACSINKNDGLTLLANWKGRNPSDKFRLSKYCFSQKSGKR